MSMKTCFALPILVLAFSASAHDTWMAPVSGPIRAGAVLSLDLTSGERFPQAGSSIAPERIAQANCRQGGAVFALHAADKSAKSLRVGGTPPGEQSATCWVLLKPRTLDLKPDTVAHYLDEIDAPETVRKTWESGPKRWRETYTKNAKTLISGNTPEVQLAVPVGLSLEFVLQADPAVIGQRIDLLVLRGGKPVPGLSVALTGEKGAAPQRARSDTAGRASFLRPGPGRWMLSATDLRSIDAQQGTWESEFSTLVFDVPSSR